MVFVSNHSDRVGKAKLASRYDIETLQANKMVEEAKSGFVKQYQHVLEQKNKEMASKYPDAKYIARCDVILARLQTLIDTYVKPAQR